MQTGVLGREPAAIAGFVQLVFSMCVMLGWVKLTNEQIGAIMAALSAGLALLVRQSVVPTQLIRSRMASVHNPLYSRPKVEKQKDL